MKARPVMVGIEPALDALRREREYQDRKWGSVLAHSIPSWILIMEAELNEAKLAWIKEPDRGPALQEILQVAAVAVACLEQHGVVEREGGCREHRIERT